MNLNFIISKVPVKTKGASIFQIFNLGDSSKKWDFEKEYPSYMKVIKEIYTKESDQILFKNFLLGDSDRDPKLFVWSPLSAVKDVSGIKYSLWYLYAKKVAMLKFVKEIDADKGTVVTRLMRNPFHGEMMGVFVYFMSLNEVQRNIFLPKVLSSNPETVPRTTLLFLDKVISDSIDAFKDQKKLELEGKSPNASKIESARLVNEQVDNLDFPPSIFSDVLRKYESWKMNDQSSDSPSSIPVSQSQEENKGFFNFLKMLLILIYSKIKNLFFYKE